MIILPKYWAFTTISALFNSVVWILLTVWFLPHTWSLLLGALAFAVTFWIMSFFQQLDEQRRVAPDPSARSKPAPVAPQHSTELLVQ